MHNSRSLLPEYGCHMTSCFKLDFTTMMDYTILNHEPEKPPSPLSGFCQGILSQQESQLRQRGPVPWSHRKASMAVVLWRASPQCPYFLYIFVHMLLVASPAAGSLSSATKSHSLVVIATLPEPMDAPCLDKAIAEVLWTSD